MKCPGVLKPQAIPTQSDHSSWRWWIDASTASSLGESGRTRTKILSSSSPLDLLGVPKDSSGLRGSTWVMEQSLFLLLPWLVLGETPSDTLTVFFAVFFFVFDLLGSPSLRQCLELEARRKLPMISQQRRWEGSSLNLGWERLWGSFRVHIRKKCWSQP